MTTWKHKVRGSVYEVIAHNAGFQCSADPDFERKFAEENWTVYRNVATGQHFVRPTKEFLDGRFERVT